MIGSIAAGVVLAAFACTFDLPPLATDTPDGAPQAVDASCGDTQSSADHCGECGRSCRGATCAGGLCAPALVTRGSELRTLASDGETLWVGEHGTFPGLYRASLADIGEDGGAQLDRVMSVSDPRALHLLDAGPVGTAVVENGNAVFVYTPGRPTPEYRSQVPRVFSGFDVLGDEAFVGYTEYLVRVCLGADTCVTPVLQGEADLGAIAATPVALYYVAGNEIRRQPFDGETSRERIDGRDGGIGVLATSGVDVVWSGAGAAAGTPDASAGSAEVFGCKANGCSPDGGVRALGTVPGRPTFAMVSGDAVYVITQTVVTPPRSRIVRLRLSGGPPLVLVDGLEDPSELTVVGNDVFYTEKDAIYRVPR